MSAFSKCVRNSECELSEFGIPNARILLKLHDPEDAFRQSLHGRVFERRGTIGLPRRFPKVEFGAKAPTAFTHEHR